MQAAWQPGSTRAGSVDLTVALPKPYSEQERLKRKRAADAEAMAASMLGI